MDKYTDRFFKIPVRIYDMYHQEKNEDMGYGEPPEYAVGWEAIIPEEITRWYDCYEDGRTPREVRHEGFDYTTVIINKHTNIDCDWPSGKFEDELNKFMLKRQIKAE